MIFLLIVCYIANILVACEAFLAFSTVTARKGLQMFSENVLESISNDVRISTEMKNFEAEYISSGSSGGSGASVGIIRDKKNPEIEFFVKLSNLAGILYISIYYCIFSYLSD